MFQAAELVTENCEAYEAHMRGVRDYLEERLVVRAARPGPASFSQRAVRGGGGGAARARGAVRTAARCPGTLGTTKVTSEERGIK